MKILDNFKYSTLIVFSLFLGLSPFFPQPHLFEKFNMLLAGDLTRSLDIFDLVFHLSPSIVLLAKVLRDRSNAGNDPEE